MSLACCMGQGDERDVSEDTTCIPSSPCTPLMSCLGAPVIWCSGSGRENNEKSEKHGEDTPKHQNSGLAHARVGMRINEK